MLRVRHYSELFIHVHCPTHDGVMFQKSNCKNIISKNAFHTPNLLDFLAQQQHTESTCHISSPSVVAWELTAVVQHLKRGSSTYVTPGKDLNSKSEGQPCQIFISQGLPPTLLIPLRKIF